MSVKVDLSRVADLLMEAMVKVNLCIVWTGSDVDISSVDEVGHSVVLSREEILQSEDALNHLFSWGVRNYLFSYSVI
jgi:hypothetical protein